MICKGLKDFQSDRMYAPNQQAFRPLRNLHTWLLAKTAEAGAAAEVLLRMLEYALRKMESERRLATVPPLAYHLDGLKLLDDLLGDADLWED